MELANKNKYGNKVAALSPAGYYKRLYAFKDRNGIDFKLEAHRFRNTLATNMARAGHGEKAIARLLSNTTQSVSRYYVLELSKAEILSSIPNPELNVIEDAKGILAFNTVPEAIALDRQDIDYKASVPGGICKDGVHAMKHCKFYNRLFGSGGCLGCPRLAVTGENRAFYVDLKGRVTLEMDGTSGTPFVTATRNKMTLVDAALEVIDDFEGE